ncbi:sigma-54 interaction domain-containing protein [Roseivirga pacifica]|uniref:sigma-54 interaction domain-containing protein n=1 Tax=Roseivirga pacifica TaxID=1267423 RepID=UPI000B7EC62A|nr:sigma-54 dependent transcriptional regulator [Roseivirga pacifica]MCO6357269.1 AAA domain-containing protein [Roseivirga pacifica]MCO6368017.1 AAA domain-containing protein [Roseivirga pacifica]MCO6369501.1 AAA domain-containing protein [Roseivirga pacifica]MCO6373355.1 AAA domain-containing protein [Roseivirga pacifica]MCO6377388.1 AAA domain-containing protein [Roseivirga pacifica]
MLKNSELLSIKQRFGIIGNSPKLNHAIEVAAQVAPTDMTVLITGESGSGKESFSKIIHQLSARKHGKFIAINCGAIPEGTIDSELFGHEKGSFTGAYEARKGYFEVTNGGTIFLDEIGEMPVQTQARLLRVLENGEFIKVGSSKVQKTDVRVVAATNVNLIQAVEKGKFREDLYYRLSTVPIFVPPLRDRGNDVDLLFRKFATDFAEKYRVESIKLDDAAKAVLLRFRFPGNIRQLKNLVEQMSALEMERHITDETLLKYLPSANNSLPAIYRGGQSESSSENFNERDILYKVLFDMKKDVTDLKKLVHGLIDNGSLDQSVMKENPNLFKSLDAPTSLHEDIQPPARSSSEPIYLQPDENNEDDYPYESVHDITHEEDESLSIEEKEKELIIKALRKNNNKRKYAAQDLGISERTLYRKIKQYEIE